ncbi:unnamed protein product [Darwinula stevensoni]|uniref:TRAF1-6 MATH domain-containing protein n=1 Tax=Darwinula stevensoni TaxID=69355 RepID=A0A7R9FRA3_9CRUS|nr:unnamed protein product [Darwinula stevensoni]CAG0900623.1 unnamed protein product [Darwinula stevensoni]
MGPKAFPLLSTRAMTVLLCFGIPSGMPRALPPSSTAMALLSDNTTESKQEMAEPSTTQNACTTTSNDLEDLARCVQYLNTCLEDLSSRFNRCMEGTDFRDSERVFIYDWRVPAEAMENYTLGERLTCERFNISPGGYRMFLMMYPTGDATKDDAYLPYVNLFAGIARGVHDDHLLWPFVLEYHLILVDQTEDHPLDAEVAVNPRRNCMDMASTTTTSSGPSSSSIT